MKDHNYFINIVTNKNKSVLYIGVTSDLQQRVYEHENSLIPGFTQKYNCHYLIYYEHFQDINIAIEREKTLKNGDGRKRKTLLMNLTRVGDF